MIRHRMLPAYAVALVATAGASFTPVVSSAQALDAPPALTSAPRTPSQSATWLFTWGAPAPDAGFELTGYQVSIDGGAWIAQPTTSHVATLAEGAHTFRVRGVQRFVQTNPPTTPEPQPPDGTPASIAVRVDRTAPTVLARLDPPRPNGLNGWYRSLRVTFTCQDPGGSGIASCSPTDTIGDRGSADQGRDQTRTGSATDNVGLAASGTSPRFDFDALNPTPGAPKVPTPNARVGAPPTFTWTAGSDGTSGPDRYEILLSWSGRPEFAAASIPHAPGRREFSSPQTSGPAPPDGVSVTWRVRIYDRAGNASVSTARAYRVDSTIPPAPAITAGPSGPTNRNDPTFSWTGALGGFAWSVTQAGAEAPSQSGSGGTSATLSPLPDGEYTFQLTQTSDSGVLSDEATRSFQIDTVPPSAPRIILPPPPTSSTASPVVGWAGEEGASFRWRVSNASGGEAQGPTETPLTSAALGPFGTGGYTFRLQQIDPAGNVSPAASESFVITGPPVARGTPARFALPRANARQLRPKLGSVVRTRTPRLAWPRGRAGTTLYNVQVFRVTRWDAGRAPTLKKVLSAFPRGTHLVLRASATRGGSCYVWRVWPFLKHRFTPKPLGISNFCLAKPSVIRRAKGGEAGARAREGAETRPGTTASG